MRGDTCEQRREASLPHDLVEQLRQLALVNRRLRLHVELHRVVGVDVVGARGGRAGE